MSKAPLNGMLLVLNSPVVVIPVPEKIPDPNTPTVSFTCVICRVGTSKQMSGTWLKTTMGDELTTTDFVVASRQVCPE